MPLKHFLTKKSHFFPLFIIDLLNVLEISQKVNVLCLKSDGLILLVVSRTLCYILCQCVTSLILVVSNKRSALFNRQNTNMIRKVNSFGKYNKIGNVVLKTFNKKRKLQLDNSRNLVSKAESERRIIILQICIAIFIAILASLLATLELTQRIRSDKSIPYFPPGQKLSLYLSIRIIDILTFFIFQNLVHQSFM